MWCISTMVGWSHENWSIHAILLPCTYISKTLAWWGRQICLPAKTNITCYRKWLARRNWGFSSSSSTSKEASALISWTLLSHTSSTSFHVSSLIICVCINRTEYKIQSTRNCTKAMKSVFSPNLHRTRCTEGGKSNISRRKSHPPWKWSTMDSPSSSIYKGSIFINRPHSWLKNKELKSINQKSFQISVKKK